MKRTLAIGIVVALVQLFASSGCKTVSRALNSGGTIFVVDLIPGEESSVDAVEKAMKIMQFRLDAVGIDGEVARSGEYRLDVKIFGAHDLARLRNFLFKTYKLQLKKVVSPSSPSPAQTFPERGQAEAAAQPGHEVLPYAEMGEGTPARFLIVEKDPIVTGEQIRNASAVSRTGSDMDYQISFTLKPEGAAKFSDWTGKNINNYLAVVLDGEVQSVAYIKTQISDMGEISGPFSKVEAEEIANALNSGYMPWELKVIEEKAF